MQLTNEDDNMIDAIGKAAGFDVIHKAPYVAFGQRRLVPIKVFITGSLAEGVYNWDHGYELWVERPEDYYALMSAAYAGRKVRVISRADWMASRVIS